jgi:outer membrane protein TolC
MTLTKFIFYTIFLNIFIQNTHSITLNESFKSALANNQGENIFDASLKQSIAAKNREQGSFLPNLSLRGSYLKQDKLEDQKVIGLNLISNLYNGGKDSTRIDNSVLDIEITKNNRQIDRVSLYIETVNSYYNYLLSTNDVNNLLLLKKQSQERSDDIKSRVLIGRSRKGELLQAEAQLASVDAQLLDGIGLFKQSEAIFTILTGLKKEQIGEMLIEDISLQEKSLDDYLKMAMSKEDIKNKEIALNQIQFEIDIAKSHFQPKLDLLSNWYALKKGGSSTARDSNWDIGLNLNIPLYEGGVSAAKVREIVEKRQIALYQIIDYKKNIQVEVSAKYESYNRYKNQIKAFELALNKARKSYEETIKDYRLGLVSNLDVLSSLNLYLNSKRSFEKNKIQALLSLKTLEAVSGVIPVYEN